MYGLCDVWIVWCMDCVMYWYCVMYGLRDVWIVRSVDCLVYRLCGVLCASYEIHSP